MGQERHSDKVQRHAEIKVSHMDIWVGGRSIQGRRNSGDKGLVVGVHLESLERVRKQCV